MNCIAPDPHVENSKVAALVGECKRASEGTIDIGGRTWSARDLATTVGLDIATTGGVDVATTAGVDLESQAIDESGDDVDRATEVDRRPWSMRLARVTARS